MNDALMYGYCN